MFQRLSQDQFNYMIEALCLYKKLNPDKDVSLSDKSAKEVMNFFNCEGNRHIPLLNAMAESGLSMEEIIEKSKEEMEKSMNETNNISEVSEEEEVDDDSD